MTNQQTAMTTIQERLTDGLRLLDSLPFRLSVQCGGSDPTDPRCEFDQAVAEKLTEVRRLFQAKLQSVTEAQEEWS
jgi:hypothetical protein